MQNIEAALANFKHHTAGHERRSLLSFEQFLAQFVANPRRVARNGLQVFHDLITSHMVAAKDEYPDDPESINYVEYDCSALFVDGSDHPFFADRLFANRLVKLADSSIHTAQQNKVYIFEGPPGSGKSTFLTNLLRRYEEYANSEAGLRYETIWRLPRLFAGQIGDLETLVQRLKEAALHARPGHDRQPGPLHDFVEVPCPNHDSPLLMVPREARRAFFDELFANDKSKWDLFTAKEFDWVFRRPPCAICSSLYQALLDLLADPADVLRLVHARPYRVDRRLGEGISVFNPGDRPLRQHYLTNDNLQARLDAVLADGADVRYLYSSFAKTNDGIYALMDIKGHNDARFKELHNLVTEGVHKVEHLEENVDALFIALMNPEDRKVIEGATSFTDRIQFVRIGYVLDIDTEMNILKNVFGKHVDASLLPHVLQNFARVVVATRLAKESPAMRDWIARPRDYSKFCDDELQLLKMDIYAGHIPAWLGDDDRKALTARRRRAIIAESEQEGMVGLSGRDALQLFSDFLTAYPRPDRPATMANLIAFCNGRAELADLLSADFFGSLTGLYNYTILQEVKEALYHYSATQISRDIHNYLFAINYDTYQSVTCPATKDRLEISESFFAPIEYRLLGPGVGGDKRLAFRTATQRAFAASTLTQEMLLEDVAIAESRLFRELHDKYSFHLKQKVLEPFLDNDNFRRAIKDYGSDDFKAYDQRVRTDVTFLIDNLVQKHGYSRQTAREICIYVIDHDLARAFGD